MSFIYRTLPDELYYELQQVLRKGFAKRLGHFETIKKETIDSIKTNDERTSFNTKNVERK